MLKAVEDIVATIPQSDPNIPNAELRKVKVALELEELRHHAFGRKAILSARVQRYLNDAFAKPGTSVSASIVTAITNVVFHYEKQLVARLGNRNFFSEDERVAMAEALGGPVLIEKMALTPPIVATRAKLPISGALATQGYAFYDASFYALGVSPPRYDRGIGARFPLELSAEDAAFVASIEDTIDEAQRAMVAANPPSDNVTNEANENLKLASDLLRQYDKSGNSSLAMSAVRESAEVNKAALERFAGRLTRRQAEGKSNPASNQSTNTPGQAYRFQRAWNTEKFESKGVQLSLDESTPPQAGENSSMIAADTEPDEGHYEASTDTTWWRNDIPYGDTHPILNEDFRGFGRRELYYFLARSRRLVFDEQNWGYRKPFLHDNELAFWGAFRTPSLRNVELTAPYMHNGRFLTLQDVLTFYDDPTFQVPRDIAATSEFFKANPDKHPAIGDIDLSDDDKRALYFFLLCLTDDRVKYEQAPFDHPSIRIANGYEKDPSGELKELFIDISQTGAHGHPSLASPVFPSAH